MLTADKMPEPTDLIRYEDGSEKMAMFHYAPEDCDLFSVADQFEIELEIRILDDFSDKASRALVAQYYDGDNIDVIRAWTPTVPNGWNYGGKGDSDDGPIAIFWRHWRKTKMKTPA